MVDVIRVYRVGVFEDNFPFSFRGKDGRITGFAHELLIAVERVMGLRLQRVEGTTKDLYAQFSEGRIDLMQSFAQFPEREEIADFSVPYVSMAGTVFVRKALEPPRTLEDLRGRRILVHAGSLGETVLRRAGLGDSIIHVASVEEAFERVAEGEGDATMAARLTGLAILHQKKYRMITQVDLPVSGYDVRYCFGVREGDAKLLALMNEGLAVLVQTGEFNRIYQKWFGHLEPDKYTVEQIYGAVAVGLALALLVAVAAAVKQRRLRKRIVEQAEALRVSEESHRGIFEGARDGLLVLERRSEGLYVEQINPAAARLLGREASQVQGNRWAEVMASDCLLAAAVEAAIARGLTEEFEHARSADAGSLRVRVTPLVERSLVALTDVTEAAVARKRLRQQEEQLRQKQKLEAVGTLAGGVAHDFNNLLTAIMGNVELSILELGRDHPQTPGLKLALTAGKRARDLVQQILAFSRQNPPKREVVALRPLVGETIDLLRSLARGAVEFEVNLAPNLPPILADPAQVYQVLMNVGTNAVQAMRGQPGRLNFRAEVVEVGSEMQAQHPDLGLGRYVRIGLQDTGPGMTAELQRRIFEPFFTTKPPGEGTGLGLSVVHGIMQQHGGVVTLYSQVGRGTLFHLYFPVADDGAKISADAPSAPRAAGEGRVLFVDDDPAVVQTTSGMLVHLGYTVSAHTRPEEAWTEFLGNPGGFDLVISDLTMPGLNGLQLLARIRSARRAQSCVLSSGFFSEAESREALALGLVLLPKPLSYDSLGKAVAAATRRT